MSKNVLVLLLHVLARCLLLVRASDDDFCLRSVSLPTLGGFGQDSRHMPPRSPALAAFDWDMATAADHVQLVGNYTPCHAAAPIFRYKVANGVIYSDHEANDSRYKPYRDGFLEQLVLAMWLYSDFPDVDLVVDFTDHPELCDQRIPFLRFSIFNVSNLGSQKQQQLYNMTELLAPAWVTPEYVKKLTGYTASQDALKDQQAPQALPYTRGFTIPNPEAWRSLSLTPVQLQEYTKCLQETHPWDSRRHVVFWRGQATGCSRGWPQSGGASSLEFSSFKQPHLLRNKRIQMALRLFPYPHAFDVGIMSVPRLTLECLGATSSVDIHRQLLDANGAAPPTGLHVQDVHVEVESANTGARDNPVMLARAYSYVGYLLHKQAVGMEGWADAVATLSIDGYGPAYRLPQQLLLPAVVLKQASPYQSWLEWKLHPGVHVEQFQYDLSDLELKGLQLLAAGPVARKPYGTAESLGTSNSNPWEQMADAASATVVASVDLFAQLDAFAWSIARYKEVTPWEVEAPASGHATWHVLQLDPSAIFGSKGVSEQVQLQVMQYLGANFEVALKLPAYAWHPR